ncbi:formylglycine-generating enzyme family protein [uncultured Nostoc sp.]|uniref:formylglycine-generating enzyme family protein n=1 Tax=uncultured Nostoc sp. TaxID=340711 RepID=UPI0035C9D387
MSQTPHNPDAQQPDANLTQQANSYAPQNLVQGNQNRIVQGNENQSVLGDNNTVIQGNNNTQNISFITHNYYEQVSKAFIKSVKETKNTLQNKRDDLNAEPEKEVRTRPKPKPSLRKYRFEYAEIVKPSKLFGLLKKPIINSQRKESKYFVEDLDGGVELEMIAIPDGIFFMGSSEEKNANRSEFPQHRVSVNSFFIGKYPITQKQWKAVACLPEINRPLVVDCSKFKGDSYPVEQVCWDDAVEFCDRLSQKTNRDYRLPSEAEWEYACRAGTTTLFHFGDIITPELANYQDYKAPKSSREVFHNQTTPVDNFKFPNLLGLYDMHGLVWEWCMDHWHDSYNKAPNDGKAWVNNRDNQLRVIRGGSWADIPVNCRSVSRKKARIDEQGNYLGFRVVCC